MAEHHLLTIWRIEAPLGEVYAAIHDSPHWQVCTGGGVPAVCSGPAAPRKAWCFTMRANTAAVGALDHAEAIREGKARTSGEATEPHRWVQGGITELRGLP